MLPYLADQLPGCRDTGRARIVTGKHAGNFPDMVFFAQSPDLGDRAAIFFFLINEIMMIRTGGRLWQMSNTEHLATPAEFTYFRCYLQACLTTDPDVDFVKIIVRPSTESGPLAFSARAIRDTSPEAIFARGCMDSFIG